MMVSRVRPGLSASGKESPDISTERRTKEVVSVTGSLAGARLRTKRGRMTVTVRQSNGVDVLCYFRGGDHRATFELYCLLEEGDRIEVIGYPRLTGGIRGKVINWLDLTDRQMADRRTAATPRLRELLDE